MWKQISKEKGVVGILYNISVSNKTNGPFVETGLRFVRSMSRAGYWSV